ncbi:hypothetical protein V0R52_01185 [Pseudomonas asiatica]|uniref:hypothetical protein n=1 Tax=Pseudomonas asiatica TaxID=2219225 RepID=UPI002E7C510A|nr:hypothetical protein [Pseudomonas asiatica]MEE1914997.1 hypothetical protein [Pseudomonas asiatica]
MIEAAMLLGKSSGALSPWEFIGSTELLTTSSANITLQIPVDAQPGDLLVAVMSPGNESIKTEMLSGGWQRLTTGSQDYVCVTRLTDFTERPTYKKSAANAVYASLAAFRSSGWSSVSLVANNAPYELESVTTEANNSLILSIATTPGFAGAWTAGMTGGSQTPRRLRVSSPAMAVYSANIVKPSLATNIFVNARHGSERNIILAIS